MYRFLLTTLLLQLKDVHVSVHIVVSTVEEKNLLSFRKDLKLLLRLLRAFKKKIFLLNFESLILHQ